MARLLIVSKVKRGCKAVEEIMGCTQAEELSILQERPGETDDASSTQTFNMFCRNTPPTSSSLYQPSSMLWKLTQYHGAKRTACKSLLRRRATASAPLVKMLWLNGLEL